MTTQHVERVAALGRKSTRLTTLRDQVQDDLRSKEQEAQHLDSEVKVLTKVCELFRVLMDQLVDHQVRIVEKVGTDGLKTIFHDLDLSLEADVGPKYNKIAVEFYLRSGGKNNPLSHRGRPLEAFGGGPSSVVSLILRVMAVKRLKMWPVLILDESLWPVSAEYVDPTSKFVRALAETLGFDILLVTHQTDFLEHAHTAYRCSEITEDDGSTHLSLRKT